MKRTVRVVLGDWSDDGHGKTETYLVELEGVDVSDEVLNANYQAMTARVGVDLADVCADYEEYSAPLEFLEKVQEAGFAPTPHPGRTFSAEDEDFKETDLSALAVLMFYVGHEVENFAWRLVEDEVPTLIGGGNTIVSQNHYGTQTHTTSYGYGLFN